MRTFISGETVDQVRMDMAEIIDEPAFRNRVHVFADRFHAGELLAEKLVDYAGKEDVHVLAIPAGGIQVAFVIARRLKLPLNVAVTRKLHVPWNTEAGFGAISWDGVMFINEPLVTHLRLTREEIDRCAMIEKEVIKRRQEIFKGDRPFPDLKMKTAIIVDDGLASGFSMLATLETVKRKKPKEIIVAVPTAPDSAISLIEDHADKIVCLNIRSGPFFAVADAYKKWCDLKDEDVLDILRQAGIIH